MRVMKFFGFLIVLVGVGRASGLSAHILDQNDESISSITEQVCWHTSGTGEQISKISTVTGIAQYLSSLPADHKLAACSKLYLNSVNELASLVSTSNNNVCSQEKINAIQQFHRNYILKKYQRTSKTPKVLASFFLHYVNYISQICSNESVILLDALSNSSETNNEEVDKLLNRLTKRIGVSSSSSLEYSDMFLIWSMIDLLPLQKHHKLEKYLFEGEKRVVLASNNSQVFLKMQNFCHTKLKPLYSYSLLSTMKLIHMGYYPPNSRLLDQLNGNKQARRFYELINICEALLPVHVVEQPTQTQTELVFLSREEVEKVEQRKDPPNLVECKRCSIDDVDKLMTVTPMDAVPVEKSIRTHIKSRKSALPRLLKILAKNIKAHLSDKLKRLLGSEEIDSLDENELNIYQALEECEHDYSDKNLHRSKRALKNRIVNTFSIIGLIIRFMLYAIWTLVTMFILIPIGLLYFLFMWLIGMGWYGPGYFLITGFGAFPADH